jgi:hypothetical protein
MESCLPDENAWRASSRDLVLMPEWQLGDCHCGRGLVPGQAFKTPARIGWQDDRQSVRGGKFQQKFKAPHFGEVQNI